MFLKLPMPKNVLALCWASVGIVGRRESREMVGKGYWRAVGPLELLESGASRWKGAQSHLSPWHELPEGSLQAIHSSLSSWRLGM